MITKPSKAIDPRAADQIQNLLIKTTEPHPNQAWIHVKTQILTNGYCQGVDEFIL